MKKLLLNCSVGLLFLTIFISCSKKDDPPTPEPTVTTSQTNYFTDAFVASNIIGDWEATQATQWSTNNSTTNTIGIAVNNLTLTADSFLMDVGQPWALHTTYILNGKILSPAAYTQSTVTTLSQNGLHMELTYAMSGEPNRLTFLYNRQ